MGRADETAPTCGLTHLVEHLTLPISGRRALDFNGSVDNNFTSFWASGDADLVLPFLADAAARLRSLPLERLETERNILLAEEATLGPNPTRLAFALRFGPQGHGLPGYDEYGLRVIGADSVAAWARERLVTGNAAVFLTGDPAELELDIPPGPRTLPPEPRELEGMPWPSFYGEGPFGVLAFSLLARRSNALAAAVSILEYRVQERIRHELGLSYSPSVEFMPLTADLVHVVVVADTMAVNSDQVCRETLEILDALAADGPTEEELDDERRMAERSLSDPNEVPTHLFYAAAQELFGARFRQPAELVRERISLTSDDVAAALRDALETLLVIAPPETERPEQLAAYPLSSEEVLSGRVHRPKGVSLRRKRLPRLIVGREGVSLRATPTSQVTARYADCVAAFRYPDGSRTLLTRDGFFVTVDPSAWQNGREAVRAVDAAMPAPKVVRMEPELTEKVDAVEELAQATFKRRWLVDEELDELPSRLGDEQPLGLCSATKGIRAGLLVATDSRLIFFAKILGEQWLEWPYSEIRSFEVERRPWGTKLVLHAGGEKISFSEVKRRDGEAFASVVREALRRPTAPA